MVGVIINVAGPERPIRIWSEQAYENFCPCTRGWTGQHQRLRSRCGHGGTACARLWLRKCRYLAGPAAISVFRAAASGLDSSFTEDDFGVFSDNFNGGLFGGYAGYNWQSGAWVFGVEGDINGVWNDETFNINGFDVDVGSDYLASLRGRVGYAFDRTLIFATAGVAFTQLSAEADLFNGVSLSADQSFTGWTVGAGAEYAFTDNWIGRARIPLL